MNLPGTLTAADFANMVAVELTASRSNDVGAVPPYFTIGTMPLGLPSGTYGLLVNLGEVYLCEGRHLMFSEDKTIVGCRPFWFDDEMDGWAYLGKLAEGTLKVFPDYSLTVTFPVAFEGRAGFWFSAMTELEFMQRGITGA